MYCPACANPITPGLSYCNRCGMNLNERSSGSITAPVIAYLVAITAIGVIGLGMLLGGSMVMSNEAKLPDPIVVLFMILTFLIVGFIEFTLGRQLSRLIDSKEQKQLPAHRQPTMTPQEMRYVEPRILPEPTPSVTENTTRTLKYSNKEEVPR